jgi:hypothetical protein
MVADCGSIRVASSLQESWTKRAAYVHMRSSAPAVKAGETNSIGGRLFLGPHLRSTYTVENHHTTSPRSGTV